MIHIQAIHRRFFMLSIFPGGGLGLLSASATQATGQTEDWADANDAAMLHYTIPHETWYGAYLYDYAAGAWVQAVYVYRDYL